MAHIFADRVADTATTTGTGAVTVANAAPPGFRSLNAVAASGDTFYYTIAHQTADEWEVGLGTYSGSHVFARTTVIYSSNSNNAVNFSSGTKDVFIPADPSYGAARIIRGDVATSLTAAEQTQARQNAYAAPLDALAFGGLQYNGAMDVSQESYTNAQALTSGTAKYVLDMWRAKFVRNATLAISCQQVAPPGSPSFGPAFQNCLQIKATTGLSSLANGDYVYVEQLFPGDRIQSLKFGSSGALSVTIGIWVYATIAGTFTVTLANYAPNRAKPVNVTINNAGTWEYKTITLTGDTGGTWPVDLVNAGLRLRFCFGAGSTYHGTNNSWNGSDVFATSSTSNFFASTNNVVCLTGVSMHPGSDAPSAGQSVTLRRPFFTELRECMRFYQMSYSYGTVPGSTFGAGGGPHIFNWPTAAGSMVNTVRFAMPMFSQPSVTPYDSAGAANKLDTQSGTWSAGTTANQNGVTDGGFGIYAGSSVTGISFAYTADARPTW